AFTLDYGQTLLGGGRYDGALLPYAAGFYLGLERLLGALPQGAGEAGTTPQVLTHDDPPARRLRAAGIAVARALASEPSAAEREALAAGIPFLLVAGTVSSVGEGGAAGEARRLELQAILSGAQGDEA